MAAEHGHSVILLAQVQVDKDVDNPVDEAHEPGADYYDSVPSLRALSWKHSEVHETVHLAEKGLQLPRKDEANANEKTVYGAAEDFLIPPAVVLARRVVESPHERQLNTVERNELCKLEPLEWSQSVLSEHGNGDVGDDDRDESQMRVEQYLVRELCPMEPDGEFKRLLLLVYPVAEDCSGSNGTLLLI